MPESLPETQAYGLDRIGGWALSEVCRLKHQDVSSLGRAPQLRAKFGYHTPDEWYEATLLCLVTGATRWLDVGGGRSLLPNEPFARLLAGRCRLLVGLDPSKNIHENQLVHERVHCPLESYHPGQEFDVVSLRMVAEHISDPGRAVAALSRLTAPGGRVLVYTVSKRSPASIAAALTPMWFHHFLKRILWNSEQRDTFPTFYLMNTRKKLRRLFAEAGFAEEKFFIWMILARSALGSLCSRPNCCFGERCERPVCAIPSSASSAYIAEGRIAARSLFEGFLAAAARAARGARCLSAADQQLREEGTAR